MSHQLAIEHDVIGVGFGPSNLALAIALDECARRSRLKCAPLFVEKQPHFTWHGGMLLPGSDMQISFLKDLVSLRDPTSPFTFVNYLHKRGRLLDFINCRTFYPSRIEFNDYLRWVAGQFKSQAAYGETIVAVEPVTAGQSVTSLRVHSRTLAGGETVRLARTWWLRSEGDRISRRCSRKLPMIPEYFTPAAISRRSRTLVAVERRRVWPWSGEGRARLK